MMQQSLMDFFIYLGATIPLMIIGILIFIWTTPYPEYKMISDGANSENHQKQMAARAAAYDIGGKILGLAIVVAAAIYFSHNIIDLWIWGTIAIILQVIAFYLVNLLAPFSVIKEIPKGNVSVAIFTSRISIAIALLMAALLSP